MSQMQIQPSQDQLNIVSAQPLAAEGLHVVQPVAPLEPGSFNGLNSTHKLQTIEATDANSALCKTSQVKSAPKRFSPQQIATLEQAWKVAAEHHHGFPTSLDTLAAEIGDTTERVKSWFARKRASIAKKVEAERKANEQEAAAKKAQAAAEAMAKRQREQEEAAERKRRRIDHLSQTRDLEELRAEVLRLDAAYEDVSGKFRQLSEKTAALINEDRLRNQKQEEDMKRLEACAKAQARDVRCSVSRLLKSQLEYHGNYKIHVSASIKNPFAFSELVGESIYAKPKQPSPTYSPSLKLKLSEEEAMRIFENPSWFKALRYGSILVPIYPLVMEYDGDSSLILKGKYAIDKGLNNLFRGF